MGCAQRAGIGVAALALVVAEACGAELHHASGPADAGSDGSQTQDNGASSVAVAGAGSAVADAGDAARTDASGRLPRRAPAMPGAGDDSDRYRDAGTGVTADAGPYVDPGCPAEPPPEFMSTCDLFADAGDCPSGWVCAPFVDYPREPCGQERYGTECTPQDPCGSASCAQGTACFLTGQGVECLQLCAFDGTHGCPNGLVCLPTDVGGVGACD